MRRLRRGRWAIRARGALSCLIGRPVVMHCEFIGGVEFAPGLKYLTMGECMFDVRTEGSAVTLGSAVSFHGMFPDTEADR